MSTEGETLIRETESSQTEASKPRRNLLINSNFARLFAGETLSGLGDAILETTLVVWIASDLAAGKSWSALAVSALLVASTIPILVVGPIAGALVDRWPDKRRTLLRADILSAVLILVLIPSAGIVSLPFLEPSSLPLAWRLGSIFVIVFLASAVAQFLRPSGTIILRDIVPDEDRARAAGLNQASSSLTLLIGPPLAAPLLFSFGAGWALGIDAASFMVSYVFVRSLRIPKVESESEDVRPASVREVFRDIGEGLRFFRASRVLTTMAIALVIVTLGLGALNALDIFFVTNNLSTPAKSYGFLSAALGAGMILGAIVWGLCANRIGLARTLWLSLVGIGVAIIVYSRMTSFEPALMALFTIGFIVPAANVSVGPIMFRTTPRELIGRVSATINPLINGSTLLGLLGGGLLYSTVMRNFDVTVLGIHFGSLDTIFLGVGVLCILGGLYATNLRVPEAVEVESSTGQCV
jgi:MFS family permease